MSGSRVSGALLDAGRGARQARIALHCLMAVAFVLPRQVGHDSCAASPAWSWASHALPLSSSCLPMIIFCLRTEHWSGMGCFH
ncbi:hypothetical protein PoB_002044700 [Plakobranchus ocellatus]|uniref:Secreted protein n=1 Tax=Plakobranchus ocellatus TaxID=259542 RepID=A0AAV3ZHG4_9GAST|nr:hypothetical protein PoB_002044700 [Plakobranchus ocellatus]